ncbi:hypothetical protein ACNI3K_09395 [Demequina sp. SO4-13]|uniref:hypothetical protein n=1 Tax=Demequina sp. SO4-13 TaxID=3401027 RepID=UPI003AF93064
MSDDADALRAEDPTCPEADLLAFLRHRSRYVRWNAAQNAGASDEFRMAALATGDKVVAEAVGSLGDALSPEVREAVFAHPARQAREGLGVSARLRSTMERLASDPDPSVRAHLCAGYAPVPEDLLRRLAKDRSAKVRAAVAFSEDIPENLAFELATDRSVVVRFEILVSHDDDLRFARLMRDDPDEDIRNHVRSLLGEPEATE